VVEPATRELKPLPPPLQAAIRLVGKLEAFRNPHTFHPKYTAIFGACQNEFMPSLLWNFRVNEKILEFQRIWSANWVKSIAWLPMAKHDFRPNLLSINPFLAKLARRKPGVSPGADAAIDMQSAKLKRLQSAFEANLQIFLPKQVLLFLDNESPVLLTGDAYRDRSSR